MIVGKIQHLLLYGGQKTLFFSGVASYLPKISFSAIFIHFTECFMPLPGLNEHYILCNFLLKWSLSLLYSVTLRVMLGQDG